MLCQIVLFCLLAAAQSNQGPEIASGPVIVSGVVIDSRDQPIAGVTVEARTAIGWEAEHAMEPTKTQTNAEGNFRFELPIEEQQLASVELSAHNADRTELGLYPIRLLGGDTSAEIRIRLSQPRTIRLQVQDPDGRPLAGATTGIAIKVTGTLIDEDGMGDRVFLQPRVTDSAGITEYQIPRGAQVFKTLAWKQGHSIAVGDYTMENPRSANHSAKFPAETLSSFPDSGTETLVISAATPTTIQVVGTNQQPIASANVTPHFIFDAESRSAISELFLLGEARKQKTNDDGEVSFSLLPKSGQVTVTVETDGYASSQQRINLDGAGARPMLQLQPIVSFVGQVQSESGEPLGGLKLTAMGVDHGVYAYRMYSAVTDDDGMYVMDIPAGKVCQIIVNDRDWAAPVQTNLVTAEDEPTKELNFTARQPTRLFGRVTHEQTGEPLADVRLQISYRDESRVTTEFEGYAKPEGNRQPRSNSQQFRTKTDAEGRYAFPLGDGQYNIALLDGSSGSQDFEISGQDALEIELWTAMRVVQFPLSGQITEQATGQPLPWARVAIRIPNQMSRYAGTADHQGRFEVTLRRVIRGSGPENIPPIEVFAASADGNLSGALELMRRVDHFTLPLAPPNSSSIVGELIGPDAEIRWGDAKIYFQQSSANGRPAASGRSGSVTTDEAGMFRIDNLTSGQTYEFFYRTEPDESESGNRRMRVSQQRVSLGKFTATDQDAEVIKVRIPASRHTGPSIRERVSRLLANTDNAVRALQLATDQPADRPLVVLFAVADEPRTLKLMELRFSPPGRVVDRFREYRLLLIPKNSREASDLASELGEQLDETNDVLMVVLDRENTKQKTIKGNDIFLRDSLSLPRLERFLQLTQ